MTEPFDLLNTPIEKGVTLVEASAGTGKTYAIEGVFLRLLLEGRVKDVRRILVVTFTNDATEELITRIRKRLRDAVQVFEDREEGDGFLRRLKARFGLEGLKPLRDALADFDDVAIHTIHGFCKRMLESAAFESGTPFRPEFLEDEAPLIEEAAYDFWRRHVYPNDLLSAVAVCEGWDLLSLTGMVRTWKRNPDTLLLPDDLDLPAVLAEVEKAVAEAGAAWDRENIEALLGDKGLAWKKNEPLHEENRDSLLDRIQSFSEGDLSAGLKALASFTPGAIRKQLFVKCLDRAPEHDFFRACDEVLKAMARLRLAFRVRFIREIHEQFKTRKRELQVLTFDDLLLQLRRALRDPDRGERMAKAIADRFDVALIDEFQDTDPVQCEIFTTAFRKGPLVFIGDPKQAIYAFRGADVFAYLGAKNKATRAYTLGRNHRSRRGLVQAVNAIFRGENNPFLFEEIPFLPADSAGKADEKPLKGDDKKMFQWWFLPPVTDGKGNPKPWNKEEGPARILDKLADEVVALLSGDMKIRGRDLRPDDIAVLVRENRQAARVQERLRKAGVPSVVSDSGDILTSREMLELEQVLHGVADPRDASAVRAALATEMWGFTADRIHDLNARDDEWERLANLLDGYREEWKRGGFIPMITRLIAGREVRRRLLAFEDGERRLTNLVHAVEFLHQDAGDLGLSPEGLLNRLVQVRRVGPKESERAELRLETDSDAVKISTVHKSKGLEYEIVFCPYLWDSWPHRKDRPALAHLKGGKVVYDHGSKMKEKHDDLAEEERFAEEMRQTYVALTRAKQRCIVAWGVIGSVGGGAQLSALRYLLHHKKETPKAARKAWKIEKNAEKHKDAYPKAFTGWEADLRAFVAENHDWMELTVLADPVDPAQWTPPREEGKALNAREFNPHGAQQLVPWRIASFSSLTRDSDREGPDHVDPPAPPDPAAPAPAGIFGFARGTRAGTCLHEVFERSDFANVGDATTGEMIEAVLRRHGFLDPRAHKGNIDPAQTVREMLRRVMTTSLPHGGFPLMEVVREKRLLEWKFYVPLEHIRSQDLSAVFREHAEGAAGREVAPHLSSLKARDLHGFLGGFVDLVFERGGKWYVIDWKSNHLGNAAKDYDRDAMWRAMCEHNYVLQYHIYTLALHRYLTWRLPGYDYDRDFGGIWYVFLRGVDGSDGHGWFYDRPAGVLLKRLDALIIASR